jgi:membrane protein implicated in regulation of membrane protease activity
VRIDIEQKPPNNIPRLRWNYTRASLFFLFLVICAIIIGVIGIYFATGYDDILHNTAFILFVISGFAFVYFTEKLLGFRKLTPKQEEKLVGLAQQHEKVSEYWRQVAEQGRYIVVDEFEAIEAYILKLEAAETE